MEEEEEKRRQKGQRGKPVPDQSNPIMFILLLKDPMDQLLFYQLLKCKAQKWMQIAETGKDLDPDGLCFDC